MFVYDLYLGYTYIHRYVVISICLIFYIAIVLHTCLLKVYFKCHTSVPWCNREAITQRKQFMLSTWKWVNMCHVYYKVQPRQYKSTVNIKNCPLSAFTETFPGTSCYNILEFDHDVVMKWKYFPRFWPFVRGLHQSPVKFPAQRPVMRSFFMFSLICN